ncbi:MAG: tetratricopeptide repeat protein [Anaerolineae bacterium]|jgi:tetratricopeptide (TPR) repeat protein|nr:tetratricopeptide repeat protein [Anaerolineae bacterium]
MSELSLQLRAEIERQRAAAGFERLLDVCRRALLAARKHTDREAEAIALYGLALAYRYTGQYADARLLNEDGALRLARDLRQEELLVDALLQSGDIRLMGSFQVYDARDFYLEALHKAADLQYHHGMALALLRLGTVFASLEQSALAGNYAREGLEFARQMALPALQAEGLNALGSVLRRQKQAGAARRCHEHALSISQAQALPLLETLSRYDLGRAHQTAGDVEQALRQYEAALALCRQTGNAEMEYRLWGAIGETCLEQQQFQPAREAFDRVLNLAVEYKNPLQEAFGFWQSGRLYYTQRQYLAAAGDFTRMLTLTRDHNNPMGEALALEWLSLAQAGQHEYTAGLESLQQARQVYTALADEAGVRRVTGALVLLYVQFAWDRLLRLVGLRY